MAEATLPVRRGRGHWLLVIGRQRELTLVALMFVLGGLVTTMAPQFLSVDNFSQVAVLASITAIAAVGEALVIITRGIDLSVEAIIGLVAYAVARSLELETVDPARCARAGARHRPCARDGQRVHHRDAQGAARSWPPWERSASSAGSTT